MPFIFIIFSVLQNRHRKRQRLDGVVTVKKYDRKMTGVLYAGVQGWVAQKAYYYSYLCLSYVMLCMPHHYMHAHVITFSLVFQWRATFRTWVSSWCRKHVTLTSLKIGNTTLP